MKSEELQGLSFENLPGLLYCYSKEGVLLGCNREYIHMFGFNAIEEAIGSDIYKISREAGADPSYVAKLKENNERLWAGESLLYEEIIRIGDEQKTFISKKYPLKNDQGEIIGAMGNSLDITKQKEVEKALARDTKMKDAYLQNIISADMPVTFYWMDREGRILGCNEFQAKTFGLDSAAELMGKKAVYYLAEVHGWEKEVAETVRANDIEVMSSGETVVKEECFVVNGVDRIFLSHKAPLKDDEDNTIGVFGFSVDITEQKQLEKSLSIDKQTRDIYIKNILKADIPVTLYWLDREGVVLGCNDFQAKVFGLDSAAELIGQKGVYYVAKKQGWSKEACDAVRANDIEVMTSGKTVVREEHFLVDGDDMLMLSHKGPLLDDENNVIGIFGFSVDITARKETERLKVEKEALQKREETLKLLAASMAHELRTPLAAIDMGAAGIIKHLPDLIEGYKQAKEQNLDVPYIPPSNVRLLEEMTANIRHEAREAFSIVDMLVFKSGLSEIDTKNFKRCSMGACLDETLERYPFTQDERALVHCERGDFEFFGDKALFIHVLFNLIKNGLYYIGVARKGEITIRVEKGKDLNKLYFRDTGQGIPADILPKVFDPFFTTSSHGTGVGLAFSQMVMEKMGGTVECSSNEGEFTEFILSFPVKK